MFTRFTISNVVAILGALPLAVAVVRTDDNQSESLRDSHNSAGGVSQCARHPQADDVPLRVDESRHGKAVALLTAPVNDNYPYAIDMHPRTRRFTLLPATRSANGQDSTECWSEGGVNNDVWYLLEADETGTWTASVKATEDTFDVRIAVYAFVSGAPSTSAIACAEGECSSSAPSESPATVFEATEGQKFYIQVGSIDLSGDGEADLELSVE